MAWPTLALGLAAVVAGLAVDPAESLATGATPPTSTATPCTWCTDWPRGTRAGTWTGRWNRVLLDHPELLRLDDSGWAVGVRTLALRAVHDHPYRFTRSLVLSGTNYLRLAGRQAVPIPDLLATRAVQAGALLLGALAIHRRRTEG
jgi:hypothetical protein